MDRLKILALSYLFPNSENPEYGIFVFNRLKAVQEFCDVKVIAPLQWFPFMSHLRRSAPVTKIKTYQKKDGLDVFYPRFFSIPKYFKWLDSVFYFLSILPIIYYLKKNENFDFDIIDVHWTYPDILSGYLLSKIFRKKFIVTIRGKEALYLDESTLRKAILTYCLKRAHAVVCLSDELKNLVENLGVEEKQINIIHNGVDSNVFNFKDQLTARKKLNLPDDKKILVSVGSLIKRKGHHELIKALSAIQDRPDIELYIIGGVNPEGDYSNELLALVQSLQLNNVHFISSVDHETLSYWYAAADLFCLATSGEGCPNVVLEALACGCPVVVSNVGAVPDIVRPGVDGLIVEPQQWSWVENISSAFNQKWDRPLIAEHMKDMGWSTCAENVVDQYQAVLTPEKRVEQKLNIIYHHRTLGDGAEGIHIREMVAAFRALGHHVQVVGPAGESVPEKDGPSRLSKIKALLPGVVFELCEVGYSVYSFAQLSWLIVTKKPDFIYDRYITFNVGGVLAAKIFKTPLFLEVNAPLALERSEQPDEKLYLKKMAFALERWVCSNSFKTIVVSTPLKKYLVSQGVAEGQIVVMPNGVNPEKFYPQEKDERLMTQLGIDQHDVVIGFTGVLRHWHGLEMLLEAFSHLNEHHKNIFLLIVGDGPIRGELDAQISTYGLPDKVKITGRIPYDNVQEYVNLFDIAVSPKATFYASPMKVIEYMALGKAVVVPNGENFLDLVEEHVTGVVFATDSSKDLRVKLAYLLDNKALSTDIGNNAIKKITTRLNWQWNANETCSMLMRSKHGTDCNS